MDEWNAVGEQVFVSLDADNGGSISPAELADGYDSLDLNRDGVIVRGEVDAPSLDTNSDGVISREEWRSTILREKMDTDQDGKISRAEYEAYRSATFAGQDRDGNRWIDQAEVGLVVSKNLGAKFTMFKF
jgi:Ca2+-binding EF-hand superfamily protein